jgi:uncharacterized cysteine cluster protein YcgN (CxxCxxCC family)
MGFWQTKTLTEMTTEEWESLCDHCGQCCLHKLEDEDTGQIAVTRIACHLLALKTCHCTRYEERNQWVPECVNLKPQDFAQYRRWLPLSCAYRLVGEGKELPHWHPLVSGDAGSVKAAGMTVSRYAKQASPAKPIKDYEDHIIRWQD